jgi:hypothetical protein
MMQSARVKIPAEGMSVKQNRYKDIDVRTVVVKSTVAIALAPGDIISKSLLT